MIVFKTKYIPNDTIDH